MLNFKDKKVIVRKPEKAGTGGIELSHAKPAGVDQSMGHDSRLTLITAAKEIQVECVAFLNDVAAAGAKDKFLKRAREACAAIEKA